MTRLAVPPRSVPGWVQGFAQSAEPGTLLPGTISDGENFVPTPAGRQRTRGGSRIMLTLHDDNTETELDDVCAIEPFTTIGGLVIGWSDAEDTHYAYRVTSDMAFSTGSEGTSRHDLTASPSASWDNASAPARPVMAEIWEKMFLADATTSISSRNELLGIDQSGTVTSPSFQFGAGSASPLFPFCVEEYNGVLFIAGYGSEDVGDLDRPEMLRHSFLGRSPDAANGFDTLAFNLIGAKGQRITALRKGRGLLLVAKENEFYRVSGFGKAFAGWQYQVEQVENTEALGITNPKALTFAEGFWFGVSASGPVRTDGFSVDSLVGPRQPDWRGIDNVAEAWVRYHPERRLVLFGLHPSEAESGRSDTFPWRVWAWDLLRGVWQPDLEFGADLFDASGLTSTTADGPSSAPSSPSTDTETASGYTGNWTNGDTSAETEFWEKEGSGGTWALISVVAAATALLARTGLNNHTEYFWRVRHRKNGLTSAFDVDAGTSAQTLIAAPGVSAVQIGVSSTIRIDMTQNADGTDVELQRQVDGGGFSVLQTFTSQPSGAFSVFDSTRSCGESVDYRARSRDASWPADSVFSATSNVDLSVSCVS